MSRREQRTAPCGRTEAAARLEHARKFHEVAELVELDAAKGTSYASVAAALAVLAGIAASDAACCKALGKRSRAQDHRAAVELLRQVEPGGPEAAKGLGRLLDLKDGAHYGVINVSGEDLKSALRSSAKLVAFATKVVQG